MSRTIEGLGLGLVGGLAGLVVMRLTESLTSPLVRERTPRPMDVFPKQRSMSPFGPQHTEDEAATDAIARIAYHAVARRDPSPRAQRRLSWAVHVGYGLLAGAAFGLLQGRMRRARMRGPLGGALYGAALWLFGDEIAVPLLGLSDKPTTYHVTRHLQGLAAHLGYGAATAATARALRSKT